MELDWRKNFTLWSYQIGERDGHMQIKNQGKPWLIDLICLSHKQREDKSFIFTKDGWVPEEEHTAFFM